MTPPPPSRGASGQPNSGTSGVEVYESIRDGSFLWINLSNDDLHAAIDVAYQRKNCRVVGLIAYQIAYGHGRADGYTEGVRDAQEAAG